jgi:hypothetical protein
MIGRDCDWIAHKLVSMRSSIVTLLSAFSHWSLVPAQIERAVDDADVTIGLWKISQHAPG